jgi:3-oxoacyl-[acyl-carrier protein] reductase
VNRASFDFSGSRVLITGGTSGIGHAIALAFRDAGATVDVTGTRKSADEYDTDLEGLDFHQLAMSDHDAIDELSASIDRLDVLVNNAGGTFPGGADEWLPDTFEASLTMNLTGAFRLSTACHDALAASSAAGGASVVNVISMSAFLSVPLVPAYSSAKAGLLALTRNLAVQWVDDHIRVNAIAPGVIETPMTAPMLGIPELIDEQMRHIPMQRLGRTDEIGPTVLFLCSEQASDITGHALAIDGGYGIV